MPLVKTILAFLLFCSAAFSDDKLRITTTLQGYGHGEPAEMIPLKGGLDHVMLHARFEGGEECVLRLLKEYRSEEDIIREVEATQLAAECGVGPKVYFFDPARRILILEYLPPDDSEVDEEQMVQKLKRMHKAVYLHTSALLQPYAFIDCLYRNVCERSKTPMLELVDEAIRVVFQIYEVQKEQPAVLSHGDFHKNNVIRSGGEVYLIDWTTAALGDRFYDLAKYTLSLAPDQREQLLAIYCGGELTEFEKAHFFLTRMVTLMTLVLNRYSSIEDVSRDVFDRGDYRSASLTAMHTMEAKRLGALKALHLFLEMSRSTEFDHSLITLASTRAA